MAQHFPNKGDTRRYRAAEDAFTSEGGFLAVEVEFPGKVVDANRGLRHPSLDFSKMVRRYATGMSAALTYIRGSNARPATPPANPSAP